MSGGDDEGFLSRWSRRKRAIAEEETQRAPGESPESPTSDERSPDTEAVAAPETPAQAPVEETLSEEELAALPPLESIDASTDITAFLKKGVPAVLRNAALRRAWASDPKIAGYLDPAREYAYDWNVPGGVPGSGPLAPDFDAKALAEKIFRGSSPKVEEVDATADRDIASQTVEDLEQIDASAKPAEPLADEEEQAQQRDVAANAAPEALTNKDSDPGEAHGHASEQNAPERGEIRPKSRRHGRARPV